MIYLDNNSTAFPDPEMMQYLYDLFSGKNFGNPSSTHFFGRSSKALLSETKEIIRSFFGMSKKSDVIFTSGATEALNLMIKSLPQGHIVSSSLEHPSIIESLKSLPNAVSYLDPSEGECMITLQQIKETVRNDTVAIVIGWVNSETGAKLDLASVASFALTRKLFLIVDAVAIVCKEEVIIPEGVSGICFSGHKIHALPGSGAAVLSPSFKLIPQIVGGGQQKGFRSGTENLWGIVSLGFILNKVRPVIHEIGGYMSFLRNLLEDQMILEVPDVKVHCRNQPRTTNISSIAFQGLEGEILQAAFDLEGLAVSYGTACASGAQTVSKVLNGMKIPEEEAISTLRFSLSRFTSETEIKEVVDIVGKTVRKLRGLSEI
ncbi:MAG: cysteine desulfurase family protein [Victivallaceae bacterium]